MKQIKITVKKVLMNFYSIAGINIENENDNTRKSVSTLKATKKRKIKNISKENKKKKDKENENKNEESLKLMNIEKNNYNCNSQISKDVNLIKKEKKEYIEIIHNHESYSKKTNNSIKNSGLLFLDKSLGECLSSNSKNHLLKLYTTSQQYKNNNVIKINNINLQYIIIH